MALDEDFEVVRKAWANEGHIRNALHLISEDVEVVPFGAALHGRVYRGHAGVLDWLDQEIAPNWEFFEVIPHEFQRVGNRLLVFGSWRARGRTSGVELDMPATWIIDVRDGKIVRWQTYTERSEALEVLGLSEQDAHADS
jgi:uncharacterized protein